MFYEQLVLAKKGPLGVVWLAAHMDKKLNPKQVQSTKIPSVVDNILNPKVDPNYQHAQVLRLLLHFVFKHTCWWGPLMCTNSRLEAVTGMQVRLLSESRR